MSCSLLVTKQQKTTVAYLIWKENHWKDVELCTEWKEKLKNQVQQRAETWATSDIMVAVTSGCDLRVLPPGRMA